MLATFSDFSRDILSQLIGLRADDLRLEARVDNSIMIARNYFFTVLLSRRCFEQF